MGTTLILRHSWSSMTLFIPERATSSILHHLPPHLSCLPSCRRWLPSWSHPPAHSQQGSSQVLGSPAEGGQSHVQHPVPASRVTAAAQPAPPHRPSAAPLRTSTRMVGSTLEEGDREEVGSCMTVKSRAICSRTRPPPTGKHNRNKPGLLVPRSLGHLQEQLRLCWADELALGSRSFPPQGPGPLPRTDSPTQHQFITDLFSEF